MKLRAETVAKIKPASKRQEFPDAICIGLCLIVQPTGKKSWQVRYRHGGVHRRMTLGPYPVLSLAEARLRARDALATVAAGSDPAAILRAAKAPKPENERNKIHSLIAQYEKRHLSNLKSGELVARELNRFIVAPWGNREISEITKRDILDLLDEIAESGREITANRIRSYLSAFLNWAVNRDIIPSSPANGIKPIVKEKSRERCLSDDEIRWFYKSCDTVGQPWCSLGKMLLFTGQRLNEVAQMSEAELKGDLWHLPPERTKNARAHEVPLSSGAMSALAEISIIENKSGYIFSTNGKTPVSGFHKARARLALEMEKLAKAENGDDFKIPHWTFHDLRRTAATGMARLGVAVRVTEAVLNHVSGTGGGIVAVYQRHDYAAEKRAALEGWGEMVADLCK